MIMPYLSRYAKRRSAPVMQAMGYSKCPEAMGDISSILSTTLNVASDPYTQELLCQIEALGTIAKGGSAPLCPETPDGTPDTAGVGNLVKGMRWYVYAQANPWVYPVAIGLGLGIPFLLGYAFGKGSK